MTAPDSLHIGIVIIGLRPDGGAESLLHTFLTELADTPHRVTVATLRQIRPIDRAAAEATGAEAVAHPASSMWSPRRLIGIVRTLRGCDVVHTHLVGANILGILAARLLRIPCVTTLHNAQTKGDAHWYHGRLEGFLLRHMDVRVIAVGADIAEARRPRLGGRTIHVLQNAISDPPVVSPNQRLRLRQEVMTDPAASMIMTAGRLEPQKAHIDLIAAVEALSKAGRSVELVIAGRGRLEESLQQLISQRGLGSIVHLLGTRPDARELLAAADVFALSSHWEGLPLALLEAMAAGTPVVVTDVGAVASLIDDETGRMVPARQPEALAAGIGAVLDDPAAAARRAHTASERVAANHGSKAWADATIEHYRAACDKGADQTAIPATGSDQAR